MKVEIVMPKMGESINEGTLIKWHKKKGDKVKKDEIIYEISTDKVDTEIPSPEDGVLVDVKVLEQETVLVGTVVAVLETNAESNNKEMKEETKKEEHLSEAKSVNGLIDVPMPKMGESITEGTILKWHKKVGDIVKRDEIIFEISTDKVDTEVPSPVDGTIAEILFAENDTVGVGVAVAKISASGEIVKPKSEFKNEEQEKNYLQEEKEFQNIRSNKNVGNSNIFYSPLVLNIARVEGVSMSELETVVGTGAGGRLTKNDLLKYVQNRKKSANLSSRLHGKKEEAASNTKTVEIKSNAGQRTEIIPMDVNRQRIMNHMINSRNTSVHVSAMIEVDMSRIYNFIEKNRETFAVKEGIKLTYMPFI
ncbi:MAG: biotin/lipoyl-containing protein, partial [Melioribacteraceae bacterium]